MDFTREPIIETVITPREGCTLVIRSSKGSGQEEYFVDALEVVIFGNAIFFRSRERPKAFLVPATDYEVLEVRETRLVLKNVGLDRSIKIAGGREASLRTTREPPAKAEVQEQLVESQAQSHPDSASQLAGTPETAAGAAEGKLDGRIDKKRDRRRNYRRRRGRDDEGKVETEGTHVNVPEGTSVELPPPDLTQDEITASATSAPVVAVLSSLLAPPPNLISETIARYKDNALFKGAFFLKDDVDLDDGLGEPSEDEVEGAEAAIDAEEEVGTRRDHDFLSREDDERQEAIDVELPNMSLDFPVYVPHERTFTAEDSQEVSTEPSHGQEHTSKEDRIEQMQSEVVSEDSAIDGPPIVQNVPIDEPNCNFEVPSEARNEANNREDDAKKTNEDHF